MQFIIKTNDLTEKYQVYHKASPITSQWSGEWVSTIKEAITLKCTDTAAYKYNGNINDYISHKQKLNQSVVHILDDNNNIIDYVYPELFI